MNKSVILVIDIGTTNIKCFAFNSEGQIIGKFAKSIPLPHTPPDQIEYNPDWIWVTVRNLIDQAVTAQSYSKDDIVSLGVTTQRASTLFWDRNSGTPVCNAISWQDIRSRDICCELNESEAGTAIKKRIGAPVETYHSLGKIIWLFRNNPGFLKKAIKNQLCFGNLDSWVVWKLTGGRLHVSDNSNAGGSHMVSLERQEWDYDLLDNLGIPSNILPQIVPSSGFLGYTDPDALGMEVPLCSLVADQHSSLFALNCLSAGMSKCTFGTGSFVLTNIGSRPVPFSKAAWNIDGHITYKLEGSSKGTGLMLRWLFEKIFKIDIESAGSMASEVNDSQGVCVVPALSGLGSPFFDANAVGLVIGLRTGVDRRHVVRACLESIAFSTYAIIREMQNTSDISLNCLRVDGGMSRNDVLMQLEADIIGVPVERAFVTESTGAGAAYLAGLETGVWKIDDLERLWRFDKVFDPKMHREKALESFERWLQAVSISRKWGEDSGRQICS